MGIVIGLDGGGTSSTLRAVGIDDAFEIERRGGPLNVTTLAAVTWRRELDALFAGIPVPDSAVLCLAGMRSTASRRAVADHVRTHVTSAELRLEPDYVAALDCFDGPVDVCVIAGTGSVVCSRDEHGAVMTSGGEGHALGDHGSAYRLGERARRIVGADLWSRTPSPPSPPPSPTAVAALAPHLTRRADRGEPVAMREVTEEMGLLATLVAGHLRTYAPDTTTASIGLCGSVWGSTAATAAFVDQLRDRAHAATATVTNAVRRPVDAALDLARELCA